MGAPVLPGVEAGPAFTNDEYWQAIRPDVGLLRNYNDPKFQSSKFWSVATLNSVRIPNGHKMKWHNLGNGNVQLRLPVHLSDNEALLCAAYQKSSPQVDARRMANFKRHTNEIANGNYTRRGLL